QPLYVSPDQRYLVSYGKDADPTFFDIDLTDLTTLATYRLATALSTAVAQWHGFDGPADGPRYVHFANLENLRPYAVFRLSGADRPGAPVVLPGRLVGLLPDGRGVLEGDKLLSAGLDKLGDVTPLADGPVADFSAFTSGGDAFFIRGPSGLVGQLT